MPMDGSIHNMHSYAACGCAPTLTTSAHPANSKKQCLVCQRARGCIDISKQYHEQCTPITRTSLYHAYMSPFVKGGTSTFLPLFLALDFSAAVGAFPLTEATVTAELLDPVVEATELRFFLLADLGIRLAQ